MDAKELTEAQIEAFEREGVNVKAMGAKAKMDEEAGDTRSASEVLAIADGNFMAFKSAASKPSARRDEIVAAL